VGITALMRAILTVKMPAAKRPASVLGGNDLGGPAGRRLITVSTSA
jgi:hypothetical protein